MCKWRGRRSGWCEARGGRRRKRGRKMCAVEPRAPRPATLTPPRSVSSPELCLPKPFVSLLPDSSVCLPPPSPPSPARTRSNEPPRLTHSSSVCDAERRLLSIKSKGEFWSEGMVSGKKAEGSVETCQRKEEKKVGRNERKVDRGGTQISWVQRTLSEGRVSRLILQCVDRGLLAPNRRYATSFPRDDSRRLSARSVVSIPRLWFLVGWMSPVRFRGKNSSPVCNKRGMSCRSSKVYGVEESKHHCPLAHTKHQHYDPNNNLQNHKLAVKSRGKYEDQIKVLARGSNLIRRLRSGVSLWGPRKRKLWRFDSFTQFKLRLRLVALTSKTSKNITSFYERLKYSGVRHKAFWRSVYTGDPGTVEGIGRPVLWESGAEGGQQRGGKAPENHGRQWWTANGSNSESGDEPGQCKGQHENDPHTTPDAANTNSIHQGNFDVFTSGRQKLSKINEGLRRSVSIDQSRSDDAFFNFTKYRDKSLNRGAKTDNISSSSEDPAADLKIALRARPSKSSDRKRSSTRRTEATHKRSGGEPSRSRRRQIKKIERSPSSRSSSSSRSGSVTRARAVSGLGLVSASRVKKNKSPKETTETPIPYEDNCKDDTQEFLRKLDSVLTDLVESEKRRISSYGQPSLQHSNEEEALLNRTSKKKSHKHKHRKVSKERDRPHIEKEEASPALQQLRATLKTVRVRKRPTPTTADILDTHSRCFTEKQPHNPRILRSQHGSQLVTQRCYQPPRRRQPRSHLHDKDYPSDFCSSDEDNPTVGRACQGVAQREFLDDTDADDRRERARSSYKEDEDDTCYGSDYQGPQGPPVRRLDPSPSHATQRLIEAADSGDHSVDSAYTGSRGATPESILYPSVKPRRTGNSLTTSSTGARPRPSRLARCSPKAERLQHLKRSILNEIREGGLYSDESINSLLDQYRRRYGHFSSADLDLVTRSIQEDLGVKPRPAEYLYQILIASEDDHSPSGAQNINATLPTDNKPLMKVPSPVKSGEFQRQRDVGHKRQTRSPSPPAPTHQSNESSSLKGLEEAEDEAWAKSVLGEVAPQLVQEAKEEASRRQYDEGDPEYSAYVADLCHQLHLKI